MTQDLRLGDRSLSETLAELQQRVRTQPSDAKLRVFLFQMLAVLGQWDRALTQLQVAGELDAGTLAMVQMYREALACEAFRRDVFAGTRTPVVFGSPEPWVAHLVEAHRLAAQGESAASQELREQAFEAAPAIPGRLVVGRLVGDELRTETVEFEWLADADPRLGPMIEAVVNGRYYWIPLARIRSIDLEPPSDLRDLVWTPVHFTWENGGEAVGIIPTRYPGSESNDDDGIRLARRTEWVDAGDDLFHGMGQRMLATDAGEFPLLEIRQIVMDLPGEEAAGGIPGETS